MKPAPNVLLFISDQQRADTMPGETRVYAHTPHLTWLTERSTAFRRAFCTSPLCAPARSSILSGLYPHTTGVYANYKLNPKTLEMTDGIELIADRLSPSDYACGYVGKWHLPTGDDRRGFRDFVRRMNVFDTDSVASDDAQRFVRRLGLEIENFYPRYLSDSPSNTGGRSTKLPLAFHHATLMAQAATHFIRSRESKRKPFLLTYSCVEPHPMGMNYFTAPCPFDRMYDPDDMYLPVTLRDAGAPAILRQRNYSGLKPTDGFSDDEIRKMIAGYYGSVSYVDHLLGILLEALITTDQLDDTLVIFTSDHGEMLGDHRALKKGPLMFEEMIRIPLLIKPPAGPEDSRVINELVSHVDLVPTILDYCGVNESGSLHGQSLKPMIEGGVSAVRTGIAAEYHSVHWGEPAYPLRCWRTEEWKHVETIDGDDELYHISEDPLEIRNLAGRPAYADVQASMKAALHDWFSETGDPWPAIPLAENRIKVRPGEWDRLAKEL